MALPHNIFDLFPNHTFNVEKEIFKINSDVEFKISDYGGFFTYTLKSDYGYGVYVIQKHQLEKFDFFKLSIGKILSEKNYFYYLLSQFYKQLYKKTTEFLVENDDIILPIIIKKHIDTLTPLFGVSINIIKKYKKYFIIEVSFDGSQEIISKYEKKIIDEILFVKNNFKEDNFTFVCENNKIFLNFKNSELKTKIEKYIDKSCKSNNNSYLVYDINIGEFHLNNFLSDYIKGFGIGKMLFNKVLSQFKIIFSPNTTMISKRIYRDLCFNENLYVILTNFHAIFIHKSLSIDEIKKRIFVNVFPDKDMHSNIHYSKILYMDDELKNVLTYKYLFDTFHKSEYISSLNLM